MSKSKVISVGIAVDLQNTQEISSQIQGMSKDLANMKLDKDLEPRLKNVEKTLAGAVKQISAMTDKIDVLSKAGGLDPKTLSDLSMLATAIADVKVEVDALSSRMNNFSKQLSNVGDIGVKQVAGNITKEIGNMTTSIDSSLNTATKSIQEGGEKLKAAYENMFDDLNKEIVMAEDKLEHGDSIKASQIFNITDEDELEDKIKKIKNTLQKDLKELANATSNYINAKTNGVDIKELEKYSSAQVKAISQLKEHFVAFYNFEELDDMSGMKLPKGMQTLVNEISGSFSDLKDQAFKTFEEIYDFIDAITKSIGNDITSNLKLIEAAMGDVVQVEAVTEKKPVKGKSKQTKGKETYAGVVLKEGMDAELIAELKTVIDNLQKYVDAHPVELDTIINPTWGTKQTQKYLKSIREQLSKKNGNIDEKLAERIYGLQDAFGKDFSDALNRSIVKLRDSLSKEGFSVGKLKIEDSAIKNFREQLSNELGAVPINVNANIVEGKNQSEEINKQFEELEALDKIDPNKIMQLVNAMKETGATLDYSDLYKNRLKQIVKGLVDGIYGSVPEAIKKTKYPNGANPLIGEFNDNSRRIKELSSKIQEGGSEKSLSFYNQQLESLIKRQKEILGELSQDVEGVSESVAEEIKDAIQKIDAATIEVGTATINIANADTTFTNANISSITSNADAKVNTTSKTQEANLVANRDELIALANKRFHELLANEFNDKLDFKDIENFVKDLRKVGITEFGSPKAIASSTTGRIIDTMLRNGYDDALQAFKSTTSSSEESKAKAQEAQQMSKLFQRFNKLYDMQTVQEKGLGSELSIKRFVDDVRKSGVDFKVAPQYQNNEIGKLINTMLTEGYKTVAEAIAIRDNKPIEESPKKNLEKATINVTNLTIKGQQNIEKVTQRVTSATIEVQKGNTTIAGATTTVKNPDGNNSASTPTPTPSSDTIKANEKANKKLQSLIDKYNQNINNADNMSLKEFLKKQEKLLSDMDLAIRSKQNDDQSIENAEVSAAESLKSIDSKILHDSGHDDGGAYDSLTTDYHLGLISEEDYYKQLYKHGFISEEELINVISKSLDDNQARIDKAIDKLDSMLTGTTIEDRYELFRSGKIYQTDFPHELSYLLESYSKDNKEYAIGSARTLLEPHETTQAIVGAHTVEAIHNHPSNDLTPSYADVYSWFQDLDSKIDAIQEDKYRAHLNDDDFIDSDAYHQFYGSIVNGLGEYFKFDMSHIIDLDESERNQIRDKILKGLVASIMYSTSTNGPDFTNEFINLLLGEDGSFRTYAINDDDDKHELLESYNYDLDPVEIESFFKLFDFIDKNFDLNALLTSREGGYGADYNYTRSFYKKHENEINKLTGGAGDDSLETIEEIIRERDSLIEEFISQYNKISEMFRNGEGGEELENLFNSMTHDYDLISKWDTFSDDKKFNYPQELFNYLKGDIFFSRVFTNRKTGENHFEDTLNDVVLNEIDKDINNISSTVDKASSSSTLNRDLTPLIQDYLDNIDNVISSTTDEALKTNLTSLRDNIQNNFSILSSQLANENINEHKEAIQDIRQNINGVNEITAVLNAKLKQVDGFLKTIADINNAINKGKDKNLSKAAQDTITKSKERIEELENIFKTAQNNNDYSEIDTESITEELINLQRAVGEAINQTVVDKLDVKGLIRKLDNLQINEVKTDPAVLSRVRELRRQLQEVANDDAREVLTEEYKGWAKEISQLTGTVSKSDRTFFGNFMKEWRHKNYQVLAQFFSFYDIIRYMREAVTVVKQYDSALIEMMKVSDETRYSLERYQQTLFDTADVIGSSALTLEQSTADWMRIGESLNEAAESARASQILMNVSEFQDINSATQALVSASQAYAELDKMEIVDKINKLGNEFPIATDQLATALQNSAAALTTQGNDLNEALALVVGGNVITQDALKTGTGIRTIALRIAGTKEAKDELAELGEGVDDFVVRTESKTRKLIMDYTAVASNGFKGVDIYNENGNLRSTYEIMQDIADIYKEIQLEDRQAGTNRANALVELLAGKNRSNIAASILTNPDTIREAYEAAQDAEGSAMRENEKYLTSVEAHMTMFKNAVDELITSLVDSGFINDVIDFGTKLINGLKEITDLLGGVGTALAGLGIGVAAKSHIFTDKNYGLLNAVKTLRTPTVAAPTILGVEDVANNLTDLNDLKGKKITKEAKDYLMTQIGTSPKSIAKVESAVEGLADAQNAAAEAAALHAAKMSAMVNIGVAAASVIVTVLITAYAKYKQSIRETQQAARDLANENQETNQSIEEYAKRIADCNKVIKDNRSTTDEIIAAENELKDIQDELNESFDNYSTLIGDVNAGLEAQNKLLITNRQIKNKETVDTARGIKTGWGNNELEETIAFFEEGKFKGFDSGSTLYQALQDLGYGQFVKYDEKTNEHYFSTGNIEDDIKILKQARTQADDTTSQYITEYINELEKELNERQSTYLAYGENEAADKYGDLYDSLMDAYINNVQEGTEETEEALKQNLKNLYYGTDSKSIKNWLSSDSYFKNYMSDILASEVDNALRSTTVTATLRRRNESESQTAEQYLGSLGERANNYGLTSEDIRKYLNGLTSGFSEDQEKVLLEIQNVVNETGLLNDEAINWLLNNNKVRDNDRVTLDNKIAEARKKAMESGLMTGEQFDSLGIKTSETLDVWNQKVFGTAKTYEEAAHMLALATSDLDKALDASTMLKNMESQYKPVFDSMAEAYKAIWSTDGFDISEVSSEQIESVRAQIESLDASLKEAGGEGFDTDAVNDFILTLSNANATETEVQDAFNNIATILVDSLNPALSQASGETAALMQKTLTEMGVTNAEAVVMSRLGYTMETYAAAKEAAAEVDIDIDKELGAFGDEELKAIATTEALSDYYNARILANSLDIQTSDDVKNLIKLCDQLDISINKIQGLAEAKKKLEYVESLESQLKTAREDGNNSYQIAALEKQLDSAQADLDSYLERVEVKYESDVEIENPNYDGNSAKSSSTSSKSDSKQKFDWIERAIKKIQRAVTNLGKVADATYKTWGERLDAIMGKTEEFHDEIGQFGRGNIDLYNRPQYINEDGSVSTVRSMSFGDEYGNEILVPTIAFDNNGNPYSMSDDEAIARYYETGEYLGLFKSIEEAEEYAEKLHEQQEAIYADGGDKFYAGKYQKLKEEIALQEQAAQAYMAEANAIGLSAEYRSKVMNGLMDIETVTNEKLKEQISDFQEYYDKATDAADAVEDLRGEIAQLAQTKFDNITKQFEEMALAIDHAANRIGSIQNKIASEGYFESSALIKQLKAGNEEKLGQLKEEAQALAASIDEAISNGDIAYGSEQWWGMYDALQNVNDQIVEMSATIASFNDQLRQLEWDKFDYIANAVNRLTEENNFLVDVLQGEEQMFEKIAYIGEDLYANGNMSNAALAVQGLHVNNLQILQKQNETYAEEIKKINKELANDPNNKKILERRNDLIDQQQDIIKGIDDEKHAIKDLIQEGYETFLDYLQKSIDKRKEALEAQKSLYDYENTVAEQTKAIASYQKQISALGGDDSEETQARLQELANNLNAAEKELQQTEYEQWLSDQEKMMDNMYNSFEKLINDRLDDLDGLVEQAIQQTADSAVGISQTIQTEADEFLYELDNTSFGMNIDARISDVIGTVNNVENAINNMINAANVNAQNELAQLQALAATVATQAAVSAAQRQAQINTTPSSNSTNTTTPTTTTQKTVDNSAKIKELESQIRSWEQVVIYYRQKLRTENLDTSKSVDAYKYQQYNNQITNAQQKIDTLNKQIETLKKAKYAKGGTIGKAIKKTGEDGIILARSGEEVLSLERVKQMQGIFKMMQPLAAMNPKTISNIGGSTTVNGMNVSFALPNVTSYEDFVQKAKSDPTFEKIVQSMTIGTSLGKSKLSKYSL